MVVSLIIRASIRRNQRAKVIQGVCVHPTLIPVRLLCIGVNATTTGATHTHTKKIVVTALSQVVGVDSIIIITMRNPTQRTLLLVKVLCFKAFFGFLFAFIVAAVHIIS